TWAGSAAVPAGAGDARLLEWTVIVPTVEHAAAAARRVGAAGFGVEGANGGWVLADPWGTVVRVVGTGAVESGDLPR
ncbi:MAG: hypothetical protein H0T68_11455, partial [Gemmatimonadales bacterium]|nr:hypothetical protein [Gemmatimonadales bacterium]